MRHRRKYLDVDHSKLQIHLSLFFSFFSLESSVHHLNKIKLQLIIGISKYRLYLSSGLETLFSKINVLISEFDLW